MHLHVFPAFEILAGTFLTVWLSSLVSSFVSLSPMCVCGGLNENGAHRSLESGTTRKSGPVAVGVAMLEEVCHLG